MITRILGMQFTRVASAAFLIGGFSILSRLLGLVRNRIFTGEFGAGRILDVYYVGFLIPDFIYNLFVLGLLSAVFIPIFSKYFHEDKNEAWHFANTALNALLVLLLALSLVLFILMPFILPFIVSGFSEDMKNEVVSVARLMLLSPILLGLSSIFGSIVQNFKKYVYYALAPVFYNFGIIFGAIFLGPFWGAYGLAAGVVIGAFLHFLIQMAGAFHVGFKYRPIFDFGHIGLWKMGRLSVARFLSLAASQVNFIILTSIGSFLMVGSIAIFNLANDLQFIPIGIVALSYAVAIFPKLSEAAAKGDNKEFNSEFTSSFKQIIFWIMPISVFFVLLREELVYLLYGIDILGFDSTKLIAATLGIFAFSIFAQSLSSILSRAFYALQNTVTPFFANLISIVITVSFSFVFIALFNAQGGFRDFIVWAFGLGEVSQSMIIVLSLPLAFSFGAISNFLILVFFAKKEIKEINFLDIRKEGAKVLLSSAAILPVIIFAKKAVVSYIVPISYSNIFIEFLSVLLSGSAVYIFVLWILKSQELIFFKNMVFSVIRKSELVKAKEGLPVQIEEDPISSKEQ